MKKVISIFLIVTLLFAMTAVVIPASAEEIFDPTNVGNNVINSENRAEYVSTLPEGAIAVDSKSDLIGATESGKYYYLTADITFGTGEYASPVSGTTTLDGVTIDGCGYTITLKNAALFAKTKNLTVKNVTFDGAITASNNSQYHILNSELPEGYINIENVTASVDFVIINKTDRKTVGALSENVNNSTVKNVLNEGSVTLKSSTTKINAIGGMFGTASRTTFENVVNKGTLTVEGIDLSSNVAIGGIVGYAEKGTFKNCVNEGAIKSAAKGTEVYLGGITAYTGTRSTFENCTNNGDITILAGGKITAMGGIMAMVSGAGVDFYNCTNNGAITMNGADGDTPAAVTGEPSNAPGMGIGGILGISRAKDVNIYGSSNTKNISIIASGTVAAGGILGHQYCTAAIAQNLCIEKCTNSGNITDSGAGAMLGGIAGSIRGVISTVIQDSVNTGKVTVSGTGLSWRSAGGICGMYGSVGGKLTGGNRNLDIAFDIYCCTNKGAISNTGNAGGILGHNEEMSANGLVMTFYGCTNEGAVSSSKANAAGIFGYPASKGFIVINYCENKGVINGLDAGGIISTPTTTFDGITIKNTKNSADINGVNNAAGIITKSNQELTVPVIEKCLNTGKVHAKTVSYGLSGGIIAYSRTDVIINDCVNKGTISSVNTDMAHPITHAQTVIKESKGNVYLSGCASATSISHGTAKNATQINEIIATMIFKCNNNPYNLTKAYKDATALYAQDHTTESWAPLAEAITKAEELLADRNALQVDMDAVVVDIREAIAGLVLSGKLDFRRLEQAIIDGEEEGKNWYTLTWLELFKAIRDAKVIMNLEPEEKEKLLQSDIDNAAERIYQAIRDLLEKPPIQGEIDVEANGDFSVGTLRPETSDNTTKPTETTTEEVEEEEWSEPLIDMSGDVNINCQTLIGGGAIALSAIVAIAAGIALKKKED